MNGFCIISVLIPVPVPAPETASVSTPLGPAYTKLRQLSDDASNPVLVGTNNVCSRMRLLHRVVAALTPTLGVNGPSMIVDIDADTLVSIGNHSAKCDVCFTRGHWLEFIFKIGTFPCLDHVTLQDAVHFTGKSTLRFYAVPM